MCILGLYRWNLGQLVYDISFTALIGFYIARDALTTEPYRFLEFKVRVILTKSRLKQLFSECMEFKYPKGFFYNNFTMCIVFIENQCWKLKPCIIFLPTFSIIYHPLFFTMPKK